MPRERRFCITWNLRLIRLCFLDYREDHTTMLLQVQLAPNLSFFLSSSLVLMSFCTLCVVSGVAVALKQAMTPEFTVYQMQVVANCKAMSNVLVDHGYKIVTGRSHSAALPMSGTKSFFVILISTSDNYNFVSCNHENKS